MLQGAGARRTSSAIAILAILALLSLGVAEARADHSQLSAQWHLDSATDGTTPDSSGHDLHGQDVAGSFTPGRFDNALTVANAGDGFRAPGSALLEPQQLTVVAWVKKGGPILLPYRQIVSKGGGGCAQQSYGLSTGEDGGLWWNVALKGPDGQRLNASTPAGAIAPASIWDDRWHAVAGTFDGSSADLWVDGAKVASAPVPAAGAPVDYTPPERRLAVGRYAQDVDEAIGPCDPNGFQFTGAIDEVRVYNRALGADEIAALQGPDQTTPPAVTETGPGPLAAPSPENVTKPEVRSAADGEYTCDPGTWRNVASPADFSYRWLRVDGTNVAAAADTQTYRPDAAAYGFPHFCVVSVAAPGGPVTATSSQVFFTSAGLNALPPAYGDVRIRGIDVFQVVQPKERASMFGYKPDGAFFGLCGGGTPTSWHPSLRGGCVLQTRDPQYADYEGVTLDQNKGATAVVYVDVAGAAPADPELTYDLELSATRGGRVSLGEPVVVQVKNRPRSNTAWVLSFERDGRTHGVHIRVPTAWTSGGGSIQLHARVRFPDRAAYGTAAYGTRQCDAAGCEANDTFTLNDVPFSDFPELLLATLELRRTSAGQGALPAPSLVLAKARSLFPGGSRISVSPYRAVLDITAATNLTATPVGAPSTDLTCNSLTYATTGGNAFTAATATRDCRDRAVAALVTGWITANPARRKVLRGSTISPRAYDAVMGVHDYSLPSGNPEPGSARGRITAVSRSTPRGADTPFFTATSRTRPLTAAAHELGHILTADHAGQQCPVAVGQPGNLTGPGKGANTGEVWSGDDQGRLQSVKFIRPVTTLRGSTIPATPSRAIVDGPYTLANGSLFDPALFDLMSYCVDTADTATSDGNAWLSARNWNHFARELSELGSRLTAAPRAATRSARGVIRQSGAGSRAAFATGVAGPGGGKIMQIVPTDGDDDVPAPVPGSPFTLRSLGPDGRVLQEAGIEVVASSESLADQGGSFAGPVAAGAVAVELLGSGTVLDRFERSRPPAVRLLAPRRGIRVRSGGRLDVRWQASDPDGDALRATVDFSADDGRTWRTVHDGAGDGRASVPGSLLAAGSRARVRVSVSDGFAQKTVTSGAFTADGGPPQVRIVAPESGALLRAGERIGLAGSAQDALGRSLTGATLTWFAGDERLGTGARLRTRLPAGATTLKLVARDAQGRAAQTTLRVRVESRRLRLVSLRAPAKVGARARTVTVTVRASAASTLRAAGRRFRVATRQTTLRIPLPARPRVGVVRVPFTLAAGDRSIRGTVRGTLTVVRT